MIVEVVTKAGKHRIESPAGRPLADVLVAAGLMEGTECGRGVCGKCAVRLMDGEVFPREAGDDITRGCREGYVLACRSVTGEGDVKVGVTSARDDIQRKVRLPNLGSAHVKGDSLIKKEFLRLEPPSLNDQRSDLERIIQALGQDLKIRHSLLTNLPSILRNANFEVTAVTAANELIAIEPGDTTGEKYGFVVDIGTTTVAIYLVDLNAGSPLDAEGLANPQRIFGADVLSRITASSGPEELAKLRDLVVEGIGKAFDAILNRNNISPNRVYNVVVVGNTTMSHLFLGVEPANLAIAPFIPCYRPRVDLDNKHLDLPVHPHAYVHVLANISGYVGSDTLGVAMSTRPWEKEGNTLAVDIGTNGEILLGVNNKIYACSAAAGPAFEGAHIEQGMRAGEGAIEKVRLDNGEVTLGVIGDAPPQGICGSGLIDAVAELLKTGLLEKSGRFAREGSPATQSPLASRLRTGKDGVREFVLAYAGERGATKDIVITQKDIRELQLAKAAIAAGISILYKEAQIDANDVDRVFLAGAFGNYLDKNNAVAIGVFPGIPVEKIIPVGNAAAEGAGVCLLSLSELRRSDQVAAAIVPIELSTRADFNELWIRCINFPERQNAVNPVL